MEQEPSAVSGHFARVTGLKQDLIRIVNSDGASVYVFKSGARGI